MLLITTPSLSPELTWICSVIFSEFLGIDYVIQVAGKDHFRISHANRHIAFPDCFFQSASNAWLQESTMPVTPLPVSEFGIAQLDPLLSRPMLPMIFGTTAKPCSVSKEMIYFPFDIFGSAFFMLSRYEEKIRPQRDMHDRFPVTASLAYQEGFLDRPIVDEYVELLWAGMKQLWPQLQRKKRIWRTVVSCDVDSPFDPACASLYRLGKRLIGRTLRDKSMSHALPAMQSYLAVAREGEACDPYRMAIDWIMDVNEKAGNQVAFYFIPEKTDAKFDDRYSLEDPSLRALMVSIHQRSHEIGIHPGYNTYRDPVTFSRSCKTLMRVMREESIQQELRGGRQHYLRWETSTTARLYEANGLSYDSTLTYGDHPGFRCGTCHEYSMYDLEARKPLKLRQRPLIVMDNTWINEDDAGERIGYYKNLCRQFNGDFTLLWHNSSFPDARTKELYCEAIR